MAHRQSFWIGRGRVLILVDYDGDIPTDVWKRLEMVSRVQQLRVRWVRFDRTKHGYHMIVNVANRLGFMRTILIQALLGSDWKRETFNSRRALARHIPKFWRERRNVLYVRHFRGIML